MKEQLHKLQMLEQNLQMLLTQKHSLQSQLLSAQTAHSQLTGDVVFQFSGNILLEKDVAVVKSELEKKISLLETKISSYEKQEQSFSETQKKLQEELMGAANGGD